MLGKVSVQLRELLHWGAEQDEAWAGLPSAAAAPRPGRGQSCASPALPWHFIPVPAFPVCSRRVCNWLQQPGSTGWAVCEAECNFYLQCESTVASSSWAALSLQPLKAVPGMGWRHTVLKPNSRGGLSTGHSPGQSVPHCGALAVPWRSGCPSPRDGTIAPLFTGLVTEQLVGKTLFFFGHISPSKPLPPSPSCTRVLGLLWPAPGDVFHKWTWEASFLWPGQPAPTSQPSSTPSWVVARQRFQWPATLSEKTKHFN